MKTRRLNAVTRILLAFFSMMLFPQGTWAQTQNDDYDYYEGSSTGIFTIQTAYYGSYTVMNTTNIGYVATEDYYSLPSGTYVVNDNQMFNSRIVLGTDAIVNIILCDGFTLEAQKGIEVPEDAVLNIFGQEKGTGVLSASGCKETRDLGYGGSGDYYGAAIGGFYDAHPTNAYDPIICGTINIHGGHIIANSLSADIAAGIGGCNSSGPAALTIYGGKVEAKGGLFGAGIGGGGLKSIYNPISNDCGPVTIYGGEVIAEGGNGDPDNNDLEAMGIGRGSYEPSAAAGVNGTLTLLDGIYCYSAGHNVTDDVKNNNTRYQKMTTDAPYDLYVGPTRLFASSASNYQPGLSFYPTTNTLSLNDVTLNDIIRTRIYDFTIEFNGDNTLGDSQGCIEHFSSGTKLTLRSASSGSTLAIANTSGDPVIKGFSSVNLDGVYIKSESPIHFNNKRYETRNNSAVTGNFTVTTEPTYMLWIGSIENGFTQATDGYLASSNPGGTTPSNFPTNTVKFDVDSNTNTYTLTLDGTNTPLTINGDIESSLGNLTIDLKGTSTINYKSYGGSGAPISSTNGGSLTFKTSDSSGSLTFDGDDYGNSPFKDFSVIYNDHLELVNNAANQDEISIPAYDLWVAGTRVTVSNATNVLPNGANDGKVSYDAATNKLTLNDAQLVGDIATTMSDLNIHIKGGCEIRAKSNCIRSSATTPGTLTFTREGAGDLTLNNINAVDPNNPSNTKMTAIKGFKTLAGLPLVTQEPYEIDTYYRLKKSMSSDTSTIDYAWVNAETTYPVWVNGKQVTSENKNFVLGDNTVSFDGSNILTLDGANLTDSIVSDLASLTIGLIGDNSVYQGIRSSKATTSLTIAKDATATGNVSLLVETPYACAIWGFNSLTYTGFTPYNTDGTLDLTSTISYTSTDRALKDGGSNLNGVYFASKTDLSASGLSFSMDSKVYTGSAVVLPGTITMDDGTAQTTLTEGTDYTVTGYKDSSKNALTNPDNSPKAPTDAGDYYATIIGQDVYTGTLDVPFTIEQVTASLDWGSTNFDYDGNPHVPTPTVANLLKKDDCTVTVSGKQTNAGSYTATATGLSNINYKLPSSPTTTFTIDPRVVSLDWGSTVFTYDGDTHVPTATVNNLIKPDECNVTVTGAQTNAGTSYTATATALDNSNYQLSTTIAEITKSFTIIPCSLATASITSIPDQTYTGSAITPTPEVKIMLGNTNTTLNPGTDFDCTYDHNTNAALSTDPDLTVRPTVTITAKGNYSGMRTVYFTIEPADISTPNALVFASIEDQTYTGSPITPTPAVTFNGNTLKAGTDFEYSYSNNTVAAQSTDKPAPTVTVTGKGNYKNSASTTFTIKDRAVSIDFKGRTYHTFYNGSESFLVPDDVTAYVVKGVSGNTVTVRRVYFIKATNPVLLESTPGVTTMVNKDETYTDNLLRYGTTTAQADQYVLYNNEFVRASGNLAGKVYFDASGLNSNARTLVIGHDDDATGLDALFIEASDDDQWFDIQGRKINKPTKAGLYIRNGQKVVINNK